MNIVDKYNDSIAQKIADSNGDKSIRVDIPEYLYSIIEETAQEKGMNKTSALVFLVRSGDFLDYLEKESEKLIVEDKEGNETIVTLG